MAFFSESAPTPLPTIEQCQKFLKVVNKGRKAVDLPPLDKLNFADSKPSNRYNCLSATNLFVCPLTESMSRYEVEDRQVATDPRIAWALGMKPVSDRHFKLKKSITVVTSAFDRYAIGLEERMREAGVIE